MSTFKARLHFQAHLLSSQASTENTAFVHPPTHHVRAYDSSLDSVLFLSFKENFVTFLLWTKYYQELSDCSGFPCDTILWISSLLSSYGTCMRQMLISKSPDSEDLWIGFPKVFHGNFHYPHSCLLVLSRETFGSNKHD